MASEFRLKNLEWALLTVIFIIFCSLVLGYLAKGYARLRGWSEAEQRRMFWGFTFAGPWITGFLLFVLGPALASLYYSFTDYELGQPRHWIGLDNYRKMLLVEGPHGKDFNRAMFNSFYYALVGVPLQIVAALIMAILLNNEVPGVKFFRMAFYMPVILAGGPAILLAWRYLLTSNGGFVNLSLKKLADSFFGFDYLYRLFIYLNEAVNGFYTGLLRGDPIGSLKYTIPAVIAVLWLLTLVIGEWSESKRVRAWRGAQIIGLVVFYRLMSKGLFAKSVDVSWTYFAGAVILLGILYYTWQQRHQIVRVLQIGSLAVLALSAALTLQRSDFNLDNSNAQRYLLALALVAVPIMFSFVGKWSRAKYGVLSVVITLFALIILVRAIPGELDGNGYKAFTSYLTLGSTIQHAGDSKYLEDVYPTEIMSSMWIYALAAAALLGLALSNNRYPRAHKILLYGALLFFVLFALSTYLDGRAYFQAFEDISKATGKPNYHFALFHQAADDFPTSDRVPLWMTSELWTKPSLILITMWSSGAMMLIFLAALKGVPPSLYEAAEVDGANGMQRFFRITIPMISPAMFYNIVIGVIAALQTFETIYILQTPNTVESLTSGAFYLFTRTFRQLAIGEGAAMSWILVVIILTLTVLQFRYSRSWVHYEA